jgi:CRP-like cAMP-binding protein
MPKNTESQQNAKEKTLQFLKEAENKRAEVRFERNLSELRSDNFEILKNPEFNSKLADYAYNQFSQTTGKELQSVLDKVFGLLNKSKYEEYVAPILENLCVLCLQRYNIGLMKYICSKLEVNLDLKDSNLIITDNIYKFIVQSGCVFVRSNQWNDFDNLISKLWKIRNRKFNTSNGEGVPFQKIFSQIAVKDIIEKTAQYHKTEDKKQKAIARKTIRYFGEEAILFLLNRLVFSKNKEDRFHLIELLAAIGEEIVKPIEKFMELDLPWYAVRNLIILIAESGNPDYYKIVEGYLVHPDVRVQQQVIACIVKLGGNLLEKRLVQAIPVVDDEIKIKLVMQLGDYTSEDTANGLIDVINKRESYDEKIRADLLYKTCISLRSHPYTKVINVLKHLLRSKLNNYGLDEKLYQIVQDSIHVLEPKVRHRNKGEKAEIEAVNFNGDEFEATAESSVDVTTFVSEIDEMLDRGKIDKATSLMYKKIIDLARQKDFDAAEMLRDKLLEVNPDALQDVIRVSEIIEEEKTSPNASVQTEIWNDLFKTITTKEYEFLLSALRVEQYEKGERVVSAGEIDPCLYLLNSGTAQLSCSSGNRDTFLKRLQPGDVVGVAPFFSSSVWTVSVTAQQRSRFHVLHRDIYNLADAKYPELEEKLYDFCKRQEMVRDLVRMSGRDRRDFARYTVKINVNNILLDQYGESEGRRTFKGEMLDISRGGLSFSIRIASKKSAQHLLGRQIISEIKMKNTIITKCFGTIVSVRYLHEIAKEYSVHVKFYSELEQEKITEVVRLQI